MLCAAICSFVLNKAIFFEAQHTGMRLRIAHCSMIYKKALKLSGKSHQQSTIGKNTKSLFFSMTRYTYTG